MKPSPVGSNSVVSCSEHTQPSPRFHYGEKKKQANKQTNEALLLTQRLMKLTRHRGHRGGRETVDVQRTHLVDLGGREGHTGRQVATVTSGHEGRLLLHQLWDRRERERFRRNERAVRGSDG